MIVEIKNKKIIMPENLSVQSGDNKVDSLTFKIPKIYGSVDLNGLDAYLKFTRPNGKSDKTILTKTVDGDNLLLDLAIPNILTDFCGDIPVQISFEGGDNNSDNLVFNSEVAILKVNNSIDANAVLSERDTTFFTDLQTAMTNALNSTSNDKAIVQYLYGRIVAIKTEIDEIYQELTSTNS